MWCFEGGGQHLSDNGPESDYKLTVYWDGKQNPQTAKSTTTVGDLTDQLVNSLAPDKVSKTSKFGLSLLKDPLNFLDRSKTVSSSNIKTGDTLILIEESKHVETPSDKYRAKLLSLYSGLVFVLAMLFFFSIWPANQNLMSLNSTRTVFIISPKLSFALGGETMLALMIVIAGVIGACVYSMYAIALHTGYFRDFDQAFTSWYLLRPWIGAGLALAFYLLVGAGILNLGSSTNQDLVGVTAISSLVGLFSEHAMNKLLDLADTLFGKGPDAKSTS